MEKLKSLLNDVSKIVVKEKVLQEERRQRGELFNIFKVLHLSTAEVRLHSAFIAELLNPDGDHGLEESFLNSFINLVIKRIEDLKDFEFDAISAKVTLEFDIGPISKDGTKGGRIDILLEDKSGQLIIIENKIDAGDQPMQLLRYYNYAIEKKGSGSANKNFCILYLTKEGDVPNNISLGIKDKENNKPNEKANTKVQYECITYKKDILEWLNHCIGIAALHPGVRETISQYIINLKNILSIMNDNNKQELMKIMAANPEAAAAIINNSGDYIQYVYTTFVKPELEKFAHENNLIYKENNLFTGSRGGRGFYFHKEEWKKSAIYIWTDRMSEYDFYIGISNYQGEMLDVEKVQLDNLREKPTDGFPYGWESLQPEYINWWADYMVYMINGNFAAYIKELVLKILKELEKRKIEMP